MPQKEAAILRAFGLRATRQRIKIISVLLCSGKSITADEIHSNLIENGDTFDLSTVYRCLAQFEHCGIVEKSGLQSGASMHYNLTHNGHRHYMICTSCKSSIEIDGCPVDRFVSEIGREKGFEVSRHSFEIFGLCSKCK